MPLIFSNTHILQRVRNDTARGQSKLVDSLHHHHHRSPRTMEQVSHCKSWPRKVLNIGKQEMALNYPLQEPFPQHRALSRVKGLLDDPGNENSRRGGWANVSFKATVAVSKPGTGISTFMFSNFHRTTQSLLASPLKLFVEESGQGNKMQVLFKSQIISSFHRTMGVFSPDTVTCP